eukprot:Gregarina_sp_Poly_1__5269@NODE_2791_length_1714_cov_63_695203_g1757_i0_p4_GENE_NODE_2791_length_1714_cov_63_695203_g1757_i0NODE_2791_length_1714_cov_63_695203_g1757_i0_p4_ORF_typecomplete_len100_score12_56_NODE_2791_length_1714_cov_63_695203_g1757_i0564863
MKIFIKRTNRDGPLVSRIVLPTERETNLGKFRNIFCFRDAVSTESFVAYSIIGVTTATVEATDEEESSFCEDMPIFGRRGVEIQKVDGRCSSSIGDSLP